MRFSRVPSCFASAIHQIIALRTWREAVERRLGLGRPIECCGKFGMHHWGRLWVRAWSCAARVRSSQVPAASPMSRSSSASGGSSSTDLILPNCPMASALAFDPRSSCPRQKLSAAWFERGRDEHDPAAERVGRHAPFDRLFGVGKHGVHALTHFLEDRPRERMRLGDISVDARIAAQKKMPPPSISRTMPMTMTSRLRLRRRCRAKSCRRRRQ